MLQKINNCEYAEPVEFIIYCEQAKNYIEFDGIRVWRLMTGRGVTFYHTNVSCTDSFGCPQTCCHPLVGMAERKWKKQANEKYDKVRACILAQN